MTNASSREKRNEIRRNNYASSRPPEGTPRRRWERHEDRAILERIWPSTAEHGLTDRQLAAHLGRSVQAIQIRRSRII
jgi:hypothetical protein